MKKLLLTIFILSLFGTQASASHAAGGSIWYEYIGDSTGIPFHYKVNLELLRRNESGSASLGATLQLNLNSSCYSSQTISVQRVAPPSHLDAGDGGFLPEPKSNCSNADITDPNWINISIHRYQAYVLLPGKCSDFVFSYSLCCLNNNITNLQNPASNNIYLDSRLNNTIGPNTSPKFEISPVLSYCLNQPASSYHSAVEPDGDSLFYTLAHPWTAANTPIAFDSAYSRTQPISTLNGVYFDSIYGVMSFIPNTIENDVVKIKVHEYRMDTAFQARIFVGVTSRQVQYQIVSTCDTAKFSWSFSKDSIGIDASIDPNCYDSIVKFKTGFAFLKSSLAADGSDFTLMDVDAGNVLIPVVGATTNDKSSSLFADEVWLQLNQPIYHDGKFTITSKVGSDTNTILNICGTAIPANDSVSFNVSNCQSNFTINEHKASSIKLYPSPASDYIMIELPLGETLNHWNYTIFNIHGQQVLNNRFEKNKSRGQKVNINSLDAGLYTIKLSSSSGEVRVSKFLKK
ncbi:T9SS type A sorting domain-containing protein [Owenweeksia hongkongensis]|uniref:T9SS type A sorting domain-containing protein n=1 Tax=Owenweeksia hongkongensis TaxID=253245 RepID=UPI003A8CA1B9